MTHDLNYPESNEIKDVMKTAKAVQKRAQKWKNEADAQDEQFIKKHIDNENLAPEDMPNGEERAQLRRDILPDLSKAVNLLTQVKDGRDGKNGEIKLEPEQARTFLEQAEELVEQAESDVDGLGDVRRTS